MGEVGWPHKEKDSNGKRQGAGSQVFLSQRYQDWPLVPFSGGGWPHDTVFLNEQCKELEGNNNIFRKTGDLSKQTGDIKGIFHAK